MPPSTSALKAGAIRASSLSALKVGVILLCAGLSRNTLRSTKSIDESIVRKLEERLQLEKDLRQMRKKIRSQLKY